MEELFFFLFTLLSPEGMSCLCVKRDEVIKQNMGLGLAVVTMAGSCDVRMN